MDSFWADRWNLPWQFGDYHSTNVSVNPRATHPFEKGIFPTEYSQKAVHLVGVGEIDRMYVPAGQSRTQSMVPGFGGLDVDHDATPVAWAEVGEGMVGFVGDVNTEEGSSKVMLAMCGL